MVIVFHLVSRGHNVFEITHACRDRFPEKAYRDSNVFLNQELGNTSNGHMCHVYIKCEKQRRRLDKRCM